VRDVEDERLHRYLARAHRSGERARDLIQQMLTFSRGQQGEPRRLRLQPVIEEGMALLDSTMPASIRIERHFARDLPAVVVDPLHVEQILVNLCINARDAMAGSGALSVELQHVRPHGLLCASCRQPVSGEFVELVVGDSGSGMDAALIDRIFEPFFSTKDVGKGSGMGLATVHGIVHEYGGHIVVESVLGFGTRFRILLPTDGSTVVHAATLEDGGTVRPSARLAGRVLIVDDNFVVGEFLEELLSSWGLEVDAFGNGISAYQEFVRDPLLWDLVIVDQTMPHMTGTALAAKLLNLRPTLPVVLYTGDSDGLSESGLRQSGIRALVRKPLEVNVFRALLEEILQTT
jgi:CheY-like chemotaxis protein